MECVEASQHEAAQAEQLNVEAATPANADHDYQYMGTFVQSPILYPHHVSAAACNFRLPPPAAAASFRVPPLRCSFPSLLHPQYELVKEQCDAWILGIMQPTSPAARRLLLDCLLPRLLCRNIPAASSLLRLIQVTKMISWLIIADDEDDLPDARGADVSATTQNAALIMAILQDAPMPIASLGAGPYVKYQGAKDQLFHEVSREATSKPSKTSQSKARALEALGQLWEEMCIDMSPNLCTRFVSTMHDYFDAIKVQAAYRNAHRLPDMEAYMEIRRQASFILPAFSLVEYAIGIDLDEDVYANPQMQKFRSTAVDYICLCNDILSCRVEIGVGDYFNMPSIVYSTICANKEQVCETFQEAINFVARMVEELDAQLVSMVASIHQSSLPSLQSSSVKTYVTALGSCMSGCLAWFLETPRYCNP